MTAANAPINPVPVSPSVESERRAHEPSMEEILASIRKIIADDDALPLSRRTSPPRLFEPEVASFAPPPPADESPVRPHEPEAPADAPEKPVALPSVETASATEVEAAADEVQAPESEVPEAEDADVRLGEFEMESFAEVGRELARLDTLRGPVEAEQGDVFRPAFGEIESEAAAHEGDSAISPPPHDARYDVHAAVDEDVESCFRPGDRTYQTPVDAGAILSAEANASVASAFQALSASVQMAGAESIDRHVREMLRPMLKQWLDDNLPVMVERLVRTEIERVARGGR